eukprot:8796547-Heterocapsa_arctica.AAC.1
MARVFCATNQGIENTMLERVFEARTWPLKRRCCAKLWVFCEESNGGGEDARRPFKNRWKHLKPLNPLRT